jgi:hypothetical protein
VALRQLIDNLLVDLTKVALEDIDPYFKLHLDHLPLGELKK